MPCDNPHDSCDMPKYLPAELTQYVFNNFSKKSLIYHVTQDDVLAQRLNVEKITGHQSVRERGGVIAVLYKTHCVRLSEPSWEWEMDLQLSRTHVLSYWAGTPTSTAKRPTFTTGCALARHSLSSPGTTVNFWVAGLRLRPSRGMASPLPRHRAPQGSPLLIQGRRWVVVASKNQREYNCGWRIPGPILGRPEADQASSPSGALHDFSGGRTRFLMLPGLRSQRVPSGFPTKHR